MLIVSRKRKASIRIELGDGLDPSLTLREALAHGPILIKLMHVGLRRVRLVVEAPGAFKVLRNMSPSEFPDARNTCTAVDLPVLPSGIGKGSP